MTTQPTPAPQAEPSAAPVKLVVEEIDPFKPITLTLERPVTWAKVDYRQLTFQPATGRALRHMKIRKNAAGDQEICMEEILKVAAQLAGVPDAVILELGGLDLANAITITTGFLEPLQ